jgi:precorrin-2 dehydrogenase/sirohydrochlorin ferrochelatase
VSTYYPVALDLSGRCCIVVGGGHVAARKVSGLIAAGAAVLVVAPRICTAIEDAARMHDVEVRRRPFETSDLDDAFLVIVATDDAEANRAVADEARRRHVLVNAVDDPANCDFILPAVVRRGDVQIAVTTGGRSPALARHLRERLERLLPHAYGELAEMLGTIRSEVLCAGIGVEPERWQDAIEAALELLEADRADEALATLRARLIPSPVR